MNVGIGLLLSGARPAASSATTLMADTMARASMGAATSHGETISFDAGSAFLASIDSSLWMSNIGVSHPASYRVNVGAQSTLTLDFDINPFNATNLPAFYIGIRSDGTFGNYVALLFDGFGHLDLGKVVGGVFTAIGSRSATSFDNSGATTYHIQAVVTAGNAYSVKVNGVTDANLAGTDATFASGPYFHCVITGGNTNSGGGIKNIVLTT